MNPSPLEVWTLRCDGGSRGNPGPGACAYVLADPRGAEIEARGEYLGVCTNNVAEYRSLILGLLAASRHGVRTLVVYMDSELVVRQMLGQYKVKNEGLKPLHAEALSAAEVPHGPRAFPPSPDGAPRPASTTRSP